MTPQELSHLTTAQEINRRLMSAAQRGDRIEHGILWAQLAELSAS